MPRAFVVRGSAAMPALASAVSKHLTVDGARWMASRIVALTGPQPFADTSHARADHGVHRSRLRHVSKWDKKRLTRSQLFAMRDESFPR